MLTEQAKEKKLIEDLESRVTKCEEIILKAEKYERLKENKDWQGYLDDLKNLISLHEKEAKSGQAMLVDSPNSGYVKLDEHGKQVYVSSKQDWMDFIVRHEVQRNELSNWVKEPDRILALAAMARESLPEYKKKLAELTHVPAGSNNGKS